jgi:L-threonylcarbamoyladenylate synthase
VKGVVVSSAEEIAEVKLFARATSSLPNVSHRLHFFEPSMLPALFPPSRVLRRFVSSTPRFRSAVAAMTMQSSSEKRPHPDSEFTSPTKRRRSSPPPNDSTKIPNVAGAKTAVNGATGSVLEGRSTRILPISSTKSIGRIVSESKESVLDDWRIESIPPESWSKERQYLEEAAQKLRESDVPVGFPTETVYGLGADATRSEAVRGIYAAKRRPADNPLIVHISSYKMLRDLLRPQKSSAETQKDSQESNEDSLIPSIYTPLIQRFWPGPLTILLPLPDPSPFAPEISGTQKTFGVRFPKSPLALYLISAAGKPIAAPSANASGKPSPTCAEHVLEDMEGRIDLILDGGPCSVGVESTVVDGLSEPPAVLRPGGVSLEAIRETPGWESCIKGYKDAGMEAKDEAPRAPGMKYRHYAPKAPVLLFPPGKAPVNAQWEGKKRVGVIRTKTWKSCLGIEGCDVAPQSLDDAAAPPQPNTEEQESASAPATNGISTENSQLSTFEELWQDPGLDSIPKAQQFSSPESDPPLEIYDVNLGSNVQRIAQGLFAALRELDRLDVEVIFVEGIDDGEGETAAAIMNRLRKAAEVVDA